MTRHRASAQSGLHNSGTAARLYGCGSVKTPPHLARTAALSGARCRAGPQLPGRGQTRIRNRRSRGTSGGIIKALVAAHAAAACYRVGYKGGKRYLKVLAKFSGTHGTGTPIAAMVIKGDGTDNPQANQG
jgi:hypothetical protein